MATTTKKATKKTTSKAKVTKPTKKTASKRAKPAAGKRPASSPRAAKGGKKGTAKRPAAKNATRAKDAARTARAARPAKAKEPKAKKLSLLDAAAQVLAGHKDGLRSREMVKIVVEKGLWTPGAGRTPHASLYAAIIREIAAKGKGARFAKAERGLFVHTGKGAS